MNWGLLNSQGAIWCTICGTRLMSIHQECPKCHGDVHWNDLGYKIRKAIESDKHKQKEGEDK